MFKICIKSVPFLGEVQHSIAISDRRRWRLHLSPGVGDSQGKLQHLNQKWSKPCKTWYSTCHQLPKKPKLPPNDLIHLSSFKIPLSIQKHLYKNDPVQVRFIKAGTMEKLVESLASDTGELESTYINVFLATYRTFASPKQVLNLLTER